MGTSEPNRALSVGNVAPQPAYTYRAVVVRWVDGDTVILDIDFGYHLKRRCDVRLYGIDTPERGQRNHDEATANALSLAPPGSKVVVQTELDGTDKYGRLLGTIWVGAVDVNASQVRLGLAREYFGGTKAPGAS